MKKILVVDDSSIVRDELVKDLTSYGYQCFEAEDGEVALNIVSENTINLIISDYNMPKMNGLDMCKQLAASIPVIMMTSSSSPKLKAEGKTAGVIAWIIKPYDKEVVAQCLKVMEERNIF